MLDLLLRGGDPPPVLRTITRQPENPQNPRLECTIENHLLNYYLHLSYRQDQNCFGRFFSLKMWNNHSVIVFSPKLPVLSAAYKRLMRHILRLQWKGPRCGREGLCRISEYSEAAKMEFPEYRLNGQKNEKNRLILCLPAQKSHDG